MDMLDRQLEHEMEIPMHIPRVHDTEALECFNTLVTLQTDSGKQDIVLTGFVANTDLYFTAVNARYPKVLDVDLTERQPTTRTTPAQFLAAGLITN